ncbi:class I SAM-dependent methyltransferase [Ralstonia wenshanensis]|uniref:2-methoxy-6-polyprenyl-1,4-benzoquinol methylase, mitochondrial n=1 Tax=Ralstonia wenshanensis TaxID=2842456 RepID=A0AAD2BAY8_9RALS|nr:class I SAM-dependent methyltransferase [Ralstonia wenshanensis]CAJ0706273.1 2-methoxy-6-polyprenyl-1,4-benzoquinol methylase, mitochondrial [Ralstonia wenshanensis]
MAAHGTDQVFSGSIPELYDTLLVPLIFEPYAVDMAARAAACQPKRVLEVAAGTGAVTRALARALPATTEVVATDLNPPMLDRAAAVGTDRPVTWQQADAQQLPFADGSFDLVICQFGAMFFPDRPRAFAEARRVLTPGGKLLLSVWGRIEDNDFANVVTKALAKRFPENPPMFLARTPHGHYDPAPIQADARAGGFTADVMYDVVPARSRADTARGVAIAYCQGTPVRAELEAFGPDALTDATEVCTDALTAQFGAGPVEGKIQALMFSVTA